MKQITIRRLTLWLIMVTLCLANKLNAQMSNGLYGNEWIQFDQSYYKVKVSEDGIYRINQSALSAAGLPVANLRGDQFRLYVMGQEVPIFTSTEGVLGGNDYIEFFGRKNRAELDRELFENPDADLLNPEYSLYTDFSSYYLTWTDSGSGIRFQEVDNDLTALPTAETHFNYKQVEVYATNISNDRSAHVKRTINGDGGAYSYFDIAEGFATNFSTSHTMTIEPAFVYEANNNTTLGVRFASDNLLHQQTISLNGTQIFDESYVNFTVQDHDFDIATADIVSGVNLEFKGIDSDVDRLAIANIRLTYPRQFNFGGASSFLFDIERSGSRKYLEIENFEGSGGDVVLYDLTNNIRINTRVEDDLVKVVLPPSTVDRRLVLVNRGAGTTTLQLEAVQFIDYSAESFDYVIITHNKLFDDGQGNNYIRDYADYRRSIQGGGFEVQVVDIAQLYDQFSYGVETHPLSIRNFGHYIDKVIDNPRYVFLIGKGREYVGVRREADKNSEADLPLLIPTFGAPGSDAYLMSDGRDPVPRIPIGRLAANDGREVDIYLRKVKAFEANVNLPQTIEDRAWMKRLIHLGGGGPREQATIRRNLEGMEDIIETNLFGGDVTGFYKSSSDPVQISTSEQIFDLINSGVSIITFFGHSGANTFDFNIDNPDNYKNKNKYPLMLSLGCHIGNIHTHFQGVSERFTFDEDAGAIGFGASSSLGFVFSLNRFTQDYYSLLGGEMYGSSIGDIQKETVARLAPTAGNGMRELLQQFSFHADPALRMNPAPGPDYVVDASTIRFEPEVITSQLDSFKVRFDILNIGKGIQDSMFVEVRQQFPDRSETVVFYQKILAPASRSSLELWVPGSGRKSTGLNKLLITIDENNNIEELPALAAEDNNELTAADGSKGISFYVIDNAVIPVAPRNFSIVNQANPTLIASTSSSIFTEQRFVLEFDTTQLFNSPLKQREVITQKGGLIKWQPQGAMENDRVYYWRVSPDSIEAEVGYIWESSSFVYRPGDKEGWNQSHYYQFLENNVEQININPITRRMEMPRNILELGIENKIVYNGVNDVVPKVLFDFQEFRFMYQFEVDPTINVMVRTPSGKPLWCRPGNTYGADLRSGTASSGIPTFPFKVATEADRIELMEFLENVVQPGQYVMLYTSQLNLNSDLKVEEWAQDSIAYGKNLFSLFEEYGASQVR
ncbi:MAG: C25 family cysteine peptidase, partial [Bacteroidota bacterium]